MAEVKDVLVVGGDEYWTLERIAECFSTRCSWLRDNSLAIMLRTRWIGSKLCGLVLEPNTIPVGRKNTKL